MFVKLSTETGNDVSFAYVCKKLKINVLSLTVVVRAWVGMDIAGTVVDVVKDDDLRDNPCEERRGTDISFIPWLITVDNGLLMISWG